MKKVLVPVGVIVLALVAAWLGIPRLLDQVKKEPASSETVAATGAQRTIHTVMVRRIALRQQIELSGQVVPTETGRADVTAPLQGVIQAPLVKVGDSIAEGTPVAVINSVFGQTGQQMLQKLEQDQSALVQAQTSLSQAQNSLGQAQSTLASARTTYSQAIDNEKQADSELLRSRTELRRKHRLLEAGVAAQGDVEDAQERYDKAASAAEDAHRVVGFACTSVDVAQANLTPLQDTINLAHNSVQLALATLARDRAVFNQTELMGASLPHNLTAVPASGPQFGAGAAAASTQFYIRSPIRGTVYSVAMTSGQSVAQGAILASIVDTRELYVDGNAFESDLPSLHVGDAVEVTSPAFPHQRFPGRVRSIAKQVDPTLRTVAVRSLIHNPLGVLRQSMFVDVRIQPGAQAASLVVPQRAVVMMGDQRCVYVQTAPGQYDKRTVTTGKTVQGQVEILSGLKDADVVVTDGNLFLEGE